MKTHTAYMLAVGGHAKKEHSNMKKDELLEILRTKSVDELTTELVTLSENFMVVQDYFDLKYKLNKR